MLDDLRGIGDIQRIDRLIAIGKELESIAAKIKRTDDELERLNDSEKRWTVEFSPIGFTVPIKYDRQIADSLKDHLIEQLKAEKNRLLVMRRSLIRFNEVDKTNSEVWAEQREQKGESK